MTAEVVTSENRAEYMQARLSAAAEPAEAVVDTKTAEKAEPEPTKTAEAPADTTEDADGKGKKPNPIAERISEVTAARRAAEARAEAAEAKVRDLEAQAKPPAPPMDKDLGPEPKPADYTDAFEYAGDLAEWRTNKALKDRDTAAALQAKQAEQRRVMGEWKGRVTDFKAKTADYDTVIAAASDVSVSDDIRDAIVESKVGPEVLYHLASNRDLVERLADMSVRSALREFGKLEAKFEAASAPAPEPAPVPAPAVRLNSVKPPEPITPIRATNTSDTKVDAKGEFTGTYQQFKALREAGKLR